MKIKLSLETEFENFLKIHLLDKRPVLLALSGGPDSLCLFYLLLESKIDFHVAHVNHRWREESDSEADLLKKWCEENQVPYHERVLTLGLDEKNIEERCRKLRLNFFQELVTAFDFQSVILGHHADDVAETVLKRVFEGASLYRLKGLGKVVNFDKMVLWRPLLTVYKRDIVEWVLKKNKSFFTDKTNTDPRFLRTRLRLDLLPSLSKTFGKEVVPSLVRLASSAEELEEFVSELLNNYKDRICNSERGVTIDLSFDKPKTTFEWKAVLRDFFDKQEITLSSSTLEMLIFHLKKNRTKKEMKVGKKWVLIDNGRLTILINSNACP